MNTIRCFIAIEIEDNTTLMNILKLKKEITSLDLDMKLVEDENIHLTIRFLGEISQESLKSIKHILLDVGNIFNKFEIEVKGIGAFPSISKPRVLWIGISKSSEYLYNISRFIENEIMKKRLTDVHKDEHSFHPHITLARIKSYKNIHMLHELYNYYNNYVFGVSPVTKIKLKQSILRPQGPIYNDIFIVDLR